jgi:protein TonB
MNDREPPGRAPPDDALPGPAPSRQDLPNLDFAGLMPPDPAPDRQPPGGRPPNRALTITLLVSLGLHLAAVTVALLLLHAGVPALDTPEKPTEVELVMEERKGDTRPSASTPPSPQTPAATPAEQPAEATPPPAELPSPPVKAPVEATKDAPENTTEPAAASSPAPAVPPAPIKEVRRLLEPTPPAARQAPTISLQGTDSPSDARSWGEHVIPASPDAVFHNRPPEYPAEAVQSGEHGTVVVMIHVSPEGTAAGVDVVRSSGYLLLDRAVRVAVMRWRFLPAVKSGEPIASEVTMGFVFAFD